MASTQSFTLNINYDNAANCLTPISSGLEIPTTDEVNAMMKRNKNIGTDWTNALLTNSAKNILFPNSVAKTVKIDISYKIRRADILSLTHTVYGRVLINNTSYNEHSTSEAKNTWATYAQSDIAVNIDKTASISPSLKMNNNSVRTWMNDLSITTYFTRYDFSATAGTGITGASATPTGYNGDTITFNCSLQDGAIFDGWYNGNTRISTSQTYTYTVNGADLSLTAKATPATTHTVSMTYKGQTTPLFSTTGSVNIAYNGSILTTLSAVGTKTLQCGGKYMKYNVEVGNRWLETQDTIPATDIVITYS